MIIYFTGTGNSKLVAEYLGQLLSDSVQSLNEMLKTGAEWRFFSEKPYIIVAPIYSWRLPLFLEEILQKGIFEGSKDFYFVPTMQQNSGLAWRYCRKICQDRTFNFKGFKGVKMPGNYIVVAAWQTTKRNLAVINKALPVVAEIAETIKNGGDLHKNDFTFLPWSKSGWVNRQFNTYMVNSRIFKLNNSCTGCGICARKCPVNNIVVTNGHPHFAQKCLSCFACLHNCPQGAINFLKIGKKQGQYICPDLNDILTTKEQQNENTK